MKFTFLREYCASLLIIVAILTGSVLSKDCTLVNDCSCSMSDGSGTIDLTSLGNTDQTPRFKDVQNPDEGYYYSYNPCGGFSEQECTDAAACVLDTDKSQSQQIGDNGKARFTYDDDSGEVVAAYTAGTGVIKVTTVNLVCDKTACTPTMTPNGEQGAGQFELTLTSVCACPGMCTSSGPTSCSSGGLSPGSILLILFFSIIFLYAVGGVLFMKFKVKATGSDLIPNKGLWTSASSYTVAGFKFTVNKVLRRNDVTYDKI